MIFRENNKMNIEDKEIIDAIEGIIAYLYQYEKEHYESNPSANHIFNQAFVLNRWLERRKKLET